MHIISHAFIQSIICLFINSFIHAEAALLSAPGLAISLPACLASFAAHSFVCALDTFLPVGLVRCGSLCGLRTHHQPDCSNGRMVVVPLRPACTASYIQSEAALLLFMPPVFLCKTSAVQFLVVSGAYSLLTSCSFLCLPLEHTPNSPEHLRTCSAPVQTYDLVRCTTACSRFHHQTNSAQFWASPDSVWRPQLPDQLQLPLLAIRGHPKLSEQLQALVSSEIPLHLGSQPAPLPI